MSTVSEQLDESDLFEEGEYQAKLRPCNFSTILNNNSMNNSESIMPEVEKNNPIVRISSSFMKVS